MGGLHFSVDIRTNIKNLNSHYAGFVIYQVLVLLQYPKIHYTMVSWLFLVPDIISFLVTESFFLIFFVYLFIY